MKWVFRVLIALLVVLISATAVFAQTEKGDKELSIAASFMSRKYEHGEAWTVINIPIRLGIFVTKNVAIEPEILFAKYEEQDAGFILSCNLAYNFTLSDPESRTVPFLFSGFGFSNTIVHLPDFAMSGAEDETWTPLNLGGGVKFFLSKSAALRWEYRFQKFMGDWDYTYHNIFLGVSAFLK
jgi:hypothetical protein